MSEPYSVAVELPDNKVVVGICGDISQIQLTDTTIKQGSLNP